MNDKILAGGAALGLAYVATRGGAASTGNTTTDEQQGSGPVETFDPWTDEGDGPGDTPNTADEGEVGRSDNGVAYDDPEVGPENDEPGDDGNATFNDANEVAAATGNEPVDPSSYAPDDGGDEQGDAPSGGDGHLADAGDSQVWGSAPEQENDDLTERAANSEQSDTEKDAFDRLANQDEPDYGANSGQDDTEADRVTTPDEPADPWTGTNDTVDADTSSGGFNAGAGQSTDDYTSEFTARLSI